jgi:hypothetical protein
LTLTGDQTPLNPATTNAQMAAVNRGATSSAEPSAAAVARLGVSGDTPFVLSKKAQHARTLALPSALALEAFDEVFAEWAAAR